MFNRKTFQLLGESQTRGMDRKFRTALAQVTKGSSPLELGLATMDWISHLAISPGKQIQLAQSFLGKLKGLGVYGVKSLFNKSAVGPASDIERRMSGKAWLSHRAKWCFRIP